jgi:hypothetical protein
MPQAVSWDDALAELRRLVPGAPAFFPPDGLAPAADAVAGPARRQAVPDWADLSDLAILDRIMADQPDLDGPLLVCTAHLGFHGSPVRIAADRLRAYVAGHLDAAGECFFNGDVVVLAPAARRLLIFREGGHAHWDLSRAAPRPGV